MKLKNLINPNTAMGIAILLAILAGYLHIPFIYSIATSVSDVFINLLKLVSVPIIFLSIVSTVSGMDNVDEFKKLGKKVVKYTLMTTFIASIVALLVFLAIDPARSVMHVQALPLVEHDQTGYFTYLLQVIPSNFVQPFSESNVISVLFLAIFLSLAILALPEKNRTVLHSTFSSLYAAVMKMTTWIVWLIPLAIWSFITLFIKDMREGLEIKSLALYLCCVVIANLIQGLIVLPLFVKSNGISPVKLARGMFPALSLAFFTKSSSATLPTAMQCAEQNLGISKKMTSFTLPLCTTINMNACAAFIFTTVLFVSMSNGITFSITEMMLWTVVATIAAVGNAGVPMGCYFLASAFLAANNVPLQILGVIMPFYAMIDMLETAINVWSDSCVLAVVDKEVKMEGVIEPAHGLLSKQEMITE
jgi:Na+/H+-dicarboxylate symporter